MLPAVFLKVSLGVVRELKNVERTLDSNNKSGKTQQSCKTGALWDSLIHDYLVISEVL